MQKKVIVLKKLKIKIIKKRKENKEKTKEKKKNSRELQYPNVEAEVYNNSRKCD